MPTANYRCRDCGKLVELELPRDQVVDLYCCQRDWDHMHECTDAVQSRFDRVWSAPHIGRVAGAGGSPAR